MMSQPGTPPSERDDADRQASSLKAFQATPGHPADSPSTVHIVDTSRFPRRTDGSNHDREKWVDDLVASFNAVGQLRPGVSCPHPDFPGTDFLLCLDGNRSLEACRQLGIGFKTLVLPHAVSKAEAIRTRLASDVRKNLSLKEIGLDIAAYMDEEGCATQAEAGEALGLNPQKVTRALKIALLDPVDLARMETAGVCWTTISDIASFTGDQLRLAVDFACTASGPAIPTKEANERFHKQLKSEGKAGRKARQKQTVRFGKDSIIADFALWMDGDLKDLLKELKVLTKTVEDHSAYGMRAVIEIIRGKSRPGGNAAAVPA